MAEYIPRIVDTELDLLAEAPAISIEGPRAVGKTETALRRANTVYRLDDDHQLDVLRAEPSQVTVGEPPVLRRMAADARCMGSCAQGRRCRPVAVTLPVDGVRLPVAGTDAHGRGTDHHRANAAHVARRAASLRADRQPS